MLCLKAEALDEDHHPQSPITNSTNENENCNGGNNGGFILPINWWVFFFLYCLCFFFSRFCNDKCSVLDGFAGQALLIDICNGKVARFGAGHFQLVTTLVTLVLSCR